MRFLVCWPDGTRQNCYSPSLVIRDFLEPGSGYTVEDFLDRSRRALEIASERVRLKYGFGCTGAAQQLAEIEDTAARFDPAARMTVEAFQ